MLIKAASWQCFGFSSVEKTLLGKCTVRDNEVTLSVRCYLPPGSQVLDLRLKSRAAARKMKGDWPKTEGHKCCKCELLFHNNKNNKARKYNRKKDLIRNRWQEVFFPLRMEPQMCGMISGEFR